jgi:ankyrin repeat protein
MQWSERMMAGRLFIWPPGMDIFRYSTELIKVPVNITERTNDDETAFHLAAENGHLNVLNRLFEVKVDAMERRDDGSKALHLAAMNGHFDVLN